MIKKYVVALGLAGMLSSLPLMAFADVQALPSSPASPSVPNPMLCYDFTRTLTHNSKSYDVRALQYVLSQEGSSIPTSEFGVYGDATTQAVNAFQLKYAADILKGSSPTGTVGRMTRMKLNSLYGCDAFSMKTANMSTMQSMVPAGTKLSLQVQQTALDANGVTVKLCNLSSVDVPIFPLRIRLNGIIRDFSVPSAAKAGQCDTEFLPYATWGLTYDPGSTYGVVTAIDPTGYFKTSQISFPVSATTSLTQAAIPGAHLSIRGIQIKSGGIQGTMCNLGDTDLTSFPVSVTVNGSIQMMDVPGAYAHGKCSTVTWPYSSFNATSTPGTVINATVNVDPNNVYKETDEFDNSATIFGTI